MPDGLEVIIQYRGAKYNQVATPATASSEFAILKKDLAHLRVHSPSQKNVRRVNGSFVLHWPTAGTGPKVPGLVDSLHTRWYKLCSDDLEALKLREFLSIDSITVRQEQVVPPFWTAAWRADLVPSGVVIRSTAGTEHASPSGTLAGRLPGSVPIRPPPPVVPPPRIPPTAPRLDRQPPPHLKRRLSSEDGPSNTTRQKLDMPDAVQATTNPRPQPSQPATSDQQPQPTSSTPVDAAEASLQDGTAPQPRTQTPPKEPGEMSPRPVPTGPANAAPPRPSLAHHSPSHPGSPYASSSSSANGDSWGARRHGRDANRLTRELWDTRRQLTALQAREQAILDDLERVGVRPENSGGSVSRDALLRLEAEVRAERTRRVRAERALSDVERECAAPFVVPALFQAFMSISDLSN